MDEEPDDEDVEGQEYDAERAPQDAAARQRKRARRQIKQYLAELDSPDDTIALRAATNLVRLHGATAPASLLAASQHPNPLVRKRIAGMLAGPGAFEPLCRLVTDADAEVRAYAALALARLGDSRALQPLVTLLTTTQPGGEDAAAAARGLELMGLPVVPWLAPHLETGPEAARGLVVQILGRFATEHGDEGAVGLLMACRDDPNPTVAQQARRFLGELGWEEPESSPAEGMAGGEAEEDPTADAPIRPARPGSLTDRAAGAGGPAPGGVSAGLYGRMRRIDPTLALRYRQRAGE